MSKALAAWPLQDAKNRFSEVVRLAEGGQAQPVTRHGRRVAYVVSAQEWDALQPPEPNLIDLLLNAPHVAELLIERDGGDGRELDL